jgi:hypothetical protein
MSPNILARYPLAEVSKPWEDLPIQEVISLTPAAREGPSRPVKTEAPYGNDAQDGPRNAGNAIGEMRPDGKPAP